MLNKLIKGFDMPTEQPILRQLICFCLNCSKKGAAVQPPAPVQPLVRLPYFFFVKKCSVYSAPFVIPSFLGGSARRRSCLSLSLQTCPSFTWGFPRASTIVRMAFEATLNEVMLFPIAACHQIVP